MGHQVGAAAEGAHRHAAADDLGQRGQVRTHAGQALHALRSDAETRHDLVEDQHRAVAGAQFAQAGQEAFGRLDQVHVAGHRLDDHAGDLGAVLAERGVDHGQVVEFQGQGVRDEFRRHAGRAGVAESQQARAGLDQQAVGVAVVAALELDDLVAAGGAARQADGRHGGFGARADQAHLLQRRQAGDQHFGQLHLGFGGRAERQAVDGRFLHGAHDFGMGMAQDGRAPGTDIVDVLLALGVPDVGALRALDEARGPAYGAEGAHGRIDAAGNAAAGAIEEFGVGGHGGYGRVRG
ncbi:Uncharacterised protein [Bordetella pertussis]|nr:Uncharacterised protein [Bordetella pertussis]CFO34275.1 Uncharacterised protein [Bordetella pertussis]CFP17424.1 Uncharacterised protein [Bordetella pertussis]CFW65055.1 Uncharacterised protein [Bordetella pertussis]CPK20426.1 Uncharacterised protein [Bordetella pertussis]